MAQSPRDWQNAFDASLTAARLLAGITKSEEGLTPRVAISGF